MGVASPACIVKTKVFANDRFRILFSLRQYLPLQILVKT